MKSFLEEVNEKINGVPIQRCYHCRKCTAGCPMTSAMEHNPNRVIRMIQMGRREEVLNSATIWLCVSCETCITRCPNEVDIARMMDVLRQMAIETGVGAKEKNILKFHEANCCGQPFRMADGSPDKGPVTSITVRELRRLGLGHLAAGDLNHDRVLDERDMAAFADGVRPDLAAQIKDVPAQGAGE